MKRVGKINKKLQEQEASLCAVHKSPLKKDKERLNLVHFRNVEEERTPDQNLPKFVTTIMSRSLSNRWA